MLKKFLATILLLALAFLIINAAEVLANGEDDDRGLGIWQKLTTDQVNCSQLQDEQFETLGDFFMEWVAGSSHEAMDKHMEQIMGQEGLKEMHLAMGKRMSGCDPNAVMPRIGGTMGPSTGSGLEMMMGLKGGGQNMMGPGMMGWSSGTGGAGWMMGGWQGTWWVWSILSWITWILIIVALVAFIRWMWKKGEK